MSRHIDVETVGVRLPVSRERLRALANRVLRAERVADALVSVTFVTDREMAALNWKHLRHRGPTDVISFGFASVGGKGPLVGDVYIAPAVARRNAAAHGSGVREELMRLVVHGMLHIAGHEHPEGETRYASPMWRRQERLLRSALEAA